MESKFVRTIAKPFRRAFLRYFVGVAITSLSAIPAACSREQAIPAAPAQTPGADETAAHEDKLAVFAATSLRDAFTTIAGTWKAAHPGVELIFNFAGTQELRTQLEQGASVDVFASADHRHMSELVKAGRVAAPVLIARNEPVLVVAKEAEQTIHGIADLPMAARLVIGVPEVPIGRYTLQILDKASSTLGTDFRSKVESKVVSRELNVRQVLNKVKLGEADAGFVYRTDTLAASDLTVLTIPAELNVIAEYPIAVVSDAKHPKLAQAWIELVRSQTGKTVLQNAGFLLPEATSP